MKISAEIKDITVTQANLARALNLSPPRINQLIELKIVVRDEGDKSGGVKLLESLQNYYLSKNKGGAAESDEANFWKERAKNERAKRQLNEIKVDKAKSRLYDASVVESVMTEQLVMLRTQLLGIPSKMAAQLEMKPKAAIAELLSREIEESLMNLSEYRPELFEVEDNDDENG